MKILCPYCNAELEVEPENLNTVAPCPLCSYKMTIPALPAKFTDPKQPEAKPVSVRMIAKGVFLGLLLCSGIAIVASIAAFVLWYACVAVPHNRAMEKQIRQALEQVEKGGGRVKSLEEAMPKTLE